MDATQNSRFLGWPVVLLAGLAAFAQSTGYTKSLLGHPSTPIAVGPKPPMLTRVLAASLRLHWPRRLASGRLCSALRATGTRRAHARTIGTHTTHSHPLSHRSSASAVGSKIDGLSYPSSIKMGGARQELIGGGTRIKYGVAKVYAIGFYMALDHASGTLRDFQGLPPSALMKRAGFFDRVKGGRFAKSLLLKFHRSVTGDAIVEARDCRHPSHVYSLSLSLSLSSLTGPVPSCASRRPRALSPPSRLSMASLSCLAALTLWWFVTRTRLGAG